MLRPLLIAGLIVALAVAYFVVVDPVAGRDLLLEIGRFFKDLVA